MSLVRRALRICTFFASTILPAAQLATPPRPEPVVHKGVNAARLPQGCSCAYRTTAFDYKPIDKRVLNAIENNYDFMKDLNKTLFNTEILRQPSNTRHLLENMPPHLGSATYGTIPLVGAPNKTIAYTYFDRGSDELVIIGGGFANPREMLAPLLGIFLDYDVVIFDHVGHGIDYKPESFFGRILRLMLNIDFTALRGGEQEENEILSVARHFRTKRAYKALYGVGLCYSTGLFVRTAANHPGLFKKLILDGAWESAEALMKRFADKPELFYDPQRGNPSEQAMGFLSRQRYNIYLMLTGIQWTQRYIRGKASILIANGPSYEKLQDTPILFVHGTNDLVISPKQFNTSWDKKAGEKIAILTDGRHLQNHIKYKQLFSWSANCFLDLGKDALEHSLTSPEALADTYEALKRHKASKTFNLPHG